MNSWGNLSHELVDIQEHKVISSQKFQLHKIFASKDVVEIEISSTISCTKNKKIFMATFRAEYNPGWVMNLGQVKSSTITEDNKNRFAFRITAQIYGLLIQLGPSCLTLRWPIIVRQARMIVSFLRKRIRRMRISTSYDNPD